MPRFTRFVAITTALLVCLYLFYPNSDGIPGPITLQSAGEKTAHVIADLAPGSSTFEANLKQASEIVPPSPSRKDDPQKVLVPAPGDLRSQLTAAFPYNIESVFPSFIWQTWRITPAHPDFEFRDEEATWTERHPDFIHEVIADEVAVLLIEHLYSDIPDVLEAYHALPLPILQADFFRYLILLARGGVYSDIDTQVIRPAWEWVPDDLIMEKYGLVIGIEADPDRVDWAQWYSRRIQFCQWTMRSKPGHPMLVETVARVTEKTLAFKKAKTLSLAVAGKQSIVEWTGPAMWTDSVFDYLNSARAKVISTADKPSKVSNYTWHDLTGMTEAVRIADVVILPITGFSPGQGHMGSLSFEDSHAMVKHDFEGTWKPDDERNIGKDN